MMYHTKQEMPSRVLRPSYPATRYEPAPRVDLTAKAERERLSPSALKAFFSIMERWGIRDPDARALLGGVSNGPYYAWKKDPHRTLSEDTLTRISYLVGIFKALNTLYGEKIADAWVTLPNSHRLFGGATPLVYMKAGGVPALHVVRRLLDARRGGL
jgi:hypothetical protein